MAIFDLIRRIIAWKSSKKMDKVQVDKDSELSNLTRLGSQEVIERYQNDIRKISMSIFSRIMR